MDKNKPKIPVKEKLQTYRIDKRLHYYRAIKMYFINAFREKRFDFYDKLNKNFVSFLPR